MKIKTSELEGEPLNYAVGVIEYGANKVFINPTIKRKGIWVIPQKNGAKTHFHPSKSWAQGGRLIERKWIHLHCVNDSLWEATCPAVGEVAMRNGPTPLVAAMRAYVTTRLGEEVDVPDELLP